MKTTNKFISSRILSVFGVCMLLSFSGITQKGSSSFGLEYSKKLQIGYDLDGNVRGFDFGLYYENQFSKKFGFSSGVILNNFKRRAKNSPEIQTNYLRRETSTQIAEIPIRISYSLGERNRSYLLGGFALGLKFSESSLTQITENYSVKTMQKALDTENYWMNFHLGIVFRQSVKSNYVFSWGVLGKIQGEPINYSGKRRVLYRDGIGEVFLRIGRKKVIN